MTSKLEYLQRYMSNSGSDAADAEKKKKKKVKKSKKSKSASLGTRVVDTDDGWEQSAPSRDAIDKKWELDAAEEEQPMVVAADGEELVDPQDLPVYVDLDKYQDEFQGRKKQKEDEDGDLSPPRKKRTGRTGNDRDEKSEDASPPRRLSAANKDSRKRRQGSEDGEDASPPRRQGREPRRKEERNGDSSPPPSPRKQSGDASPPRRRPMKERSRASNRDDGDASPPRRYSSRTESSRARRDDDDDASPPRRSLRKAESSRRKRTEDSDDASPPRRDMKKEVETSVVKDENASPSRRSRRDRDDSKRDERSRRYSPSQSPVAPDRQRRVDSLGRDIPPRSKNERRSRSASREDDASSRRRDRKSIRSRSRSRDRRGRGRDRDRDRDASSSPRRGRGRRSRSQSPHPRHRRDSRSPRKSSRWSSTRREQSNRGRHPSRSNSRSRQGRLSASPSSRSRSRSHSPRRRSLRRESVGIKKERSSDDKYARKDSRATVESPPLKKVKSERREVVSQSGDSKDVKKGSTTKASDEKEKKAGLFTAAEFEHQRKMAAKRKDVLRGVDASEMGANAETVYRDKRGRKLDMLNEMVRQQEILDGKRKREEREEYEWGTGEVQKRERKSQQELLEQMKKTPFARHEDDEELERKRRERVRAFDPINSKVFQEDPLAEGKSDKKKSKKAKKKTTKTKPKYAGPPAPPNRFGIQPGYRWDGVVRGTNWEEKIMMRQNANAAGSEEAYKYAVADM